MSKVLRFWCEDAQNIRCVREEDYDAAQSELAALRQELATAKRNEHNSEVAYKAAIEKQEELRGERNELSLQASRLKVDNENYDRLLVRKSNQCDAIQQRLADDERRNAELEKQVSEFPKICITDCNFQGYNPDGSVVFEYTDGPIKRIKSFRMIGWYCKGPKPTESGASE